MHLHGKLLAVSSALVLCSGISACGAPYGNGDVQSGTVSADTSATQETELTAVSAEEERAPALNVEKIAEGIYSLDFPGSYMLDEYLEADVKTGEELDRWFMENLTNGFSTENSKYDIACSSFAAETSDGEHLFGRNYDLRPTDAMFIRTSPENGYSSIGIVDLGHLNIGQGCEAAIDSEKAQSLLLAAPYCICDGINEKGLGVSLLQLSTPHTVNETDRHDLLLYIALRAVLDKCADTDGAVQFLSQYDIYSGSNY